MPSSEPYTTCMPIWTDLLNWPAVHLASTRILPGTPGNRSFLPEDRTYLTFDEMITKESQLPADKRMDFVTIVTPNFAHFAPAMMALDNGFHVVIEKPIAFTLDEAKQLKKKVEETGLILCLTHTYSGYPMVKQARYMVQERCVGKDP